MNNYANQSENQDEATSPDINSDVSDESGETAANENIEESLRAKIESTNIAEELSDDDLKEISEQCSAGFEYDLESRKDWEQNLESWTKLALQVKEEKTYPWPKASNVKYPLLSIASMQFNARSYPSLVPSSGDVVKVEVIGEDKDGTKLEHAKRVGTYMSYQVLNQMDGWEEDMDKLLLMLPIVGTCFKKTYYNSVKKQNCSELVLPKNLIVNYWAKNLECAERVSEVIAMNPRQIKEKQMSKIYLDIDLGEPVINDLLLKQRSDANVAFKQDETSPYTIIEQHTFYDLDDDGYAEPYIITFERHTKKVLRVVARFDDTTMFVENGELQKIEPIQYYTKFSFIPNPDGGFYDIGFGLLLAPLNESVNTLINQLVDSGTLSNLQGGFLGKGLKLKMGESRWQPGEWKTVQSAADDLRKQIVPLPAKEPSAVLFQLMGTLITGAKELASVAEIFTGKMPGQNTPATTTMATVEQGMKVFTAVYKRVYRSLKIEFKKIFDLNGLYLDPNTYASVLDGPIDPKDFDKKSYDVCPGADPNTSTQSEKLMKAQGLMELLPIGVLDPVEVVRRILDAMEQPNAERLFTQQIQQTGQFQPPPDPKMLELQMKSKADQQKAALSQQQAEHKAAIDERDSVVQLAMKKQEMASNVANERMQAVTKASSQLHMDQARVQGEQMKAHQSLVQNQQAHSQKLTHAEEQNKSKIQLMKAQARAQPSSKSGKSTPSRKR